MMICIEKRFFNSNRLLLLPFGLWPCKETKFTRFRPTLLCSILISAIAFQQRFNNVKDCKRLKPNLYTILLFIMKEIYYKIHLSLFSKLFIAESNFEIFIRLLCSTTFYIILTIMYISFWFNIKSIKYLLDQLQHTYDRLKNKNEIAIYDKYGYIAKRMTTTIIILLMSGLCIITLIVHCPYIFDAVMPKNESSHFAIRTTEIVAEFFIISEKYYFLILMYMTAACYGGLIAMIAIATLFMAYLKHTCGMFEIASYRIEQAMAIELLHNFDMKNEIVIYREMKRAIDIQRQAMEFAKCLMISIGTPFFFLIITTVFCVTVNLFRIFHIESPAEKMQEVALHIFVIFTIVLTMFMGNNTGQEITDYSNHVYLITYNTSWYLAPIRVQKLILFVLQRSHKIFALNVGGLFSGSLECFATMLIIDICVMICM
ncbi:odorant receptor 24a isoform X2 [Ooceraea biroi]|uniref:odorant receptor 24a isoform X2 n=1 Tax=Ooceraea biroi TaxID=2015173 RepID=UPI0005B9731C|nr:odorant receptor 24a isoform X2 [Ooceraea biroi]